MRMMIEANRATAGEENSLTGAAREKPRPGSLQNAAEREDVKGFRLPGWAGYGTCPRRYSPIKRVRPLPQEGQ